MRIPSTPLHLTYCTNIHPADGWPAVEAALHRIAPALKARLSPSAPFGLGLRLAAREARELLVGDRLAAFRSWLDDEGLYVALINGFPYGPFHGAAVKTNVYAPDWREPARVEYTLDLIAILSRLVPEGLDGGVSTSPLSYKPWMAGAPREDWTTITQHVARVAEALVRTREATGARIHLDIEPEPDCLIENTEETIDFFERWLVPVGSPWLAARLGVGEDEAAEHLRQHVQVCLDCCHFAVEFESPVEAIDRFERAGVRVGRVQLSSALDVRMPAEPDAASAMAARLRAFADRTYLHQVVERGREGALRRFADLEAALDETPDMAGRHWRVHFHVPLFAAAYHGLRSTQDQVAAVLDRATRAPFTSHLEIETYTWDVLPPELKLDVVDSIAREYGWSLASTYRPIDPSTDRDRPIE